MSLKDSHVNPAVAYEEMMDAEDDKVIKGLTKFMFVGKYIWSCDQSSNKVIKGLTKFMFVGKYIRSCDQSSNKVIKGLTKWIALIPSVSDVTMVVVP